MAMVVTISIISLRLRRWPTGMTLLDGDLMGAGRASMVEEQRVMLDISSVSDFRACGIFREASLRLYDSV